MYYEARRHTTRKVANAMAAARLIKDARDENGDRHDYDAITWQAANGDTFVVLADGSIDNMWVEIAVINRTRMVQVASLTNAWIEGADKLGQMLASCSSPEYGFSMGTVSALPIDGEGLDATVSFTCSCCGDWFESTISKQKKYDQDCGYGYCLSCIREMVGV